MDNQYDLRKAHQEPITINNQVYVLGNAVVNAQTLEQLTYILDQLGEKQPIVIINPNANTIPNFSEKLSNLIQNNRRVQPMNVTTDDKYKFKDMSDDMLRELAQRDYPGADVDTINDMFTTYQGLRARANALWQLEQAVNERAHLWEMHCANPSSDEGAARYNELSSKILPQLQANYDLIVRQLQEWDEVRVKRLAERRTMPPTDVPAQQEQQLDMGAPVSQIEETPPTVPTPEPSTIEVVPDNTVSNRKPWGNWLAPENLKMPLQVAAEMAASPSYAELVRQQQSVRVDGVLWEAVPVQYLLALGIPTIPDGIPICYTKYGTFKRVGNSEVSPLNLDYWYPKPKGVAVL